MPSVTLKATKEFAPGELTGLLLTIRQLYIKSWLIEQSRLSELAAYTQSGDTSLEIEAGLTLNCDIPLTAAIPVGTALVLEGASEKATQAVCVALEGLGWSKEA